jgi:hypothetical protein
MTHNIITKHLSESSVSALHSILGKNVWLACFSSVELSSLDNILIAQEVVLPVEENGFLVMASDGFYDSPVAHISYYSVGIAFSSNPAGLDMTYNGHAASFGAGVSHVAFYDSTYQRKFQVMKIEIFEAVIYAEATSDGEETVHYDKAICLHRLDGTRICFCLEDGIRAFFQILFTDAQISQALKELCLRATWELA